MQKGTVIVIGGAGYIGSHAAKALAEAGYNPVTYDNMSTGNSWAVRWGDFELGDVLDLARLNEAFRRHKPVAVMHFAALALVGESMRDPSRYYRTNVTGTANVLEACRANDVSNFVFSSTCAVYGSPETVPITEDTPKAPINPYGASKLMAERLLEDYGMAYGLRHVALRYFNAAGADPDGQIGERRDVETHLIPLMLDAAAGLRAPIKVMGTDYPTPDGTAIRDYIHVSDLASAHVRALDHLMSGGEPASVNLGVGQGYSVQQVLDAAQTVIGRTVPHETADRRAGDPPQLVANPAAARTLFGGNNAPNSDLNTIIETAWRWQSSEAYKRAFVA